MYLPQLLSFLQAYGYPMLWLTTFIAALGAPLPITLLLLAAGAFSAAGDFNIVVLAVVALSASVTGDSVGYWIGRLWGSQLLEWMAETRLGKQVMSPETLARSREYFQRRGGIAIFLTRSLISALGSVTNVVAGSELYPYRLFLLYDVLGEALGAILPLGLGYIAGASWEALGDIFSAVAFFALGAVCVIYLGYRLLWRSAEGARLIGAERIAPGGLTSLDGEAEGLVGVESEVGVAPRLDDVARWRRSGGPGAPGDRPEQQRDI
jgi:membrane-associated protein